MVLMDINLKGDMDGIEASRQISEMGIPIIFLTANTDDPTTFDALKTAPYGYLSKPYTTKDLELTVKMALRKHEEDIKTIIKTEDKVKDIMFLVNEMVAMSVDEATKITFGIEKDGDDAIINYSCDASMAGCGENIFFEQMIKQIDANPEYSDCDVSIRFRI